ncbi:MAG TPA: AAA family ATPase [Acidimicrobiales bacterium]|nr:AAA family ATPase [Acidimicrobiales bacterium]
MPGATTTITVLVTDLVGSTELLRHGAEGYDEIRRTHLAAVRDALGAHHGEEVKSTGDGVLATFVSAADAVACAGAVQQAVTRLRRRDPRSPAVRVGVACGEATPEDGDWYGPPVIEASRLCGAAEGGQVLLSGLVPMLVGDRGNHTFALLGERHLKGFDAPTTVVELAWSPTADPDQPPLPPAAEQAGTGFLVGRDAELDELLGAWKQAAAGERRTLLLAGEPGVGKTRLVGELARAAHAEGASVLWGRCDEEVAAAYQPFEEALRHAPGTELGAPLGKARRSDLARLLPELGEAPVIDATGVGADPEGERLRLFDAVGQMLVDVTAHRPVVLVLDDVHWGAAPALLLLRHLVRDPRPAAVLVVATYRDTDLDRTHPLAGVLADLRRAPGVVRLSLTGLTVEGTAAYLDAAAGEALGERGAELAEAIHRETEGNPFFVEHVLHHLVEVGALAQVGGTWTATGAVAAMGIPEGVREVVGRRLSRLSDAANRALATAAVVGREFDLETLEAVPDAGEPDHLLDAVEEAVAARLVDESGPAGRFVFSHSLVRQTLLAELTAARQARLHRRVGEALAARPGVPPALVAHHLCAGITAESAKLAISWAMQAMDESWLHLAFEEGTAIGQRAMAALELVDDPSPALRADVLRGLATAAQYAGDVDRAKAIADEAIALAREAGDAPSLSRAVLIRASWAQAGVPDPVVGDLLTEAIEALGSDERLLRATLLSARALYRAVNQNLGAVAAADAAEAVEMLSDAAPPDDVLSAVFVHASVLQGTPGLAAQRAVLDHMLEVERRAPEAVQVFNAFPRSRIEVVLAVQAGDRAAADQAVADCLDVAGRPGVGRLPKTMTAMWQAMLALAEGRFDDAEERAAVLLEMAPHDVNFQNSWAGLAFRIGLERGQAAGLVPIVRDAVAGTPDLVALQTLLARALVASGEHDEARGLLRWLTAGGLAAVPRDLLFSASLVDLTDTCALLGDRSAAAELHPLLLPYSGQLQVMAWGVHCLGAVDRYLAMTELLLGELDAADARFAAALELEESFGAPALATRTRLWWARLLAARNGPGDADRAAGLAAEAERVARSIGQVEVADSAAAFADRGPSG